MGIIKPFRDPAAKVFPDFWPTASYNIVTERLICNLPERVGVQDYFFTRKANLPGTHVSIVVQPNGVVMFYPCSDPTDAAVCKAWIDKNIVHFRVLSAAGFTGTVVGKMTRETTPRLAVYYIVENRNVIWLDKITIERLLRLFESPLNKTTLVLENSFEFTVLVNSVKRQVSSAALEEDVLDETMPEDIICFPLTHSESRDSLTATPRMRSTAEHMNFAAFTYSRK